MEGINIMLKIDKNVRNKKKEALNWVMAGCSLIGSILMISSILFNKFELLYYALAFIWFNCFIVFLKKTTANKYTDVQKKLLESNQILKTQMKAKSSAFDLMVNLFIVINFICSLVIAIGGSDGVFYKSQFFMGAYISAVIFFVVMVGIKAYYVSKYRNHICD